MSEVKPVLYLGTKLVPYEERTFRIADMRDAMGYTHDHKQFYSEEQVQKLLAESERLRAEAAREFERSARLGGQLHESQVRAERLESRCHALAEALRDLLGSVDDLTSYVAEDDEIGYRPCCNVLSYKEHADDCAITQARAVLNQENNDD